MGQPLAEELQSARLQVRSDDAFNQRIHIAALGWKRIGQKRPLAEPVQL